MSAKRQTPEICPACGAEVPPGARACPECGADEKTGWNEEATLYDGLDLPETSYEPAGEPSRLKPAGVEWHWWMLGIILLVAFAYVVLSRR